MSHCDHEKVCFLFRYGSIVAFHDGTPCMRNSNGCKPCEHDTRIEPQLPRPQCEECIYQKQSADHDRAIRNATLDELLDAFRISDEDCCHEPWRFEDIRKQINDYRRWLKIQSLAAPNPVDTEAGRTLVREAMKRVRETQLRPVNNSEQLPPCPKCGSPTFCANIDEGHQILCLSDACKWKQNIATEPEITASTQLIAYSQNSKERERG